MENNFPWPSDFEIDIAHSSDNLINHRNWSCYDFSVCKHTVMKVVDVDQWELQVCISCGAMVHKICNHIMIWNESGSMLRCSNCGIDGT